MERKPPVKISILEKDESEVSHCWKYCQIFSYVMVCISGIATTLAMGNVSRMFDHECLLYADLSLEIERNWTIVIQHHTASRWGSATHCSFTQYSPVASVIVAGIWGTIFIMCGRGGASSKNLPQPWRIIPPAILFNFIFLVLSVVSVALTFGGFSAFCASVAPQVNVTSCEDLIGFNWDRFPKATNFYDDVVLAQTGAAFVLTGWMMGFFILLIRVITHADFRVIGPEKRTSSLPPPPTRRYTLSSSSTSSSSPPSSSASSPPRTMAGSPASGKRDKEICRPLIHQLHQKSSHNYHHNNNSSKSDSNSIKDGRGSTSPV